ncbi:MAG TPA: MFS transporter [Gemmataceae bacterium]|nr:MFS transporter [Gemmataceae bacterium]
MDEISSNAIRAGRFRPLGRALAHRNYRLFFAGQFVSMIGTWMTRMASGWLVFRLSEPEWQAVWLGVVGFAGQIPAFFLAPLAGVLVDRWNRHRLLVVTQALSLLQSAALAVLAFSAEPGIVTILILIVLNVCQGLINAFDMPARQAFMVEMIDRKQDLANAIALNSSLVNGARLLGPAIAGVLIYLTSEAWCFVIDAVSYLAVIAALLAMHIVRQPREEHHAPVWHGLVEGFRYAFGFAPIRAILLLLALVSFMGMPYSVLMPIFASDLGGGSGTMGFLLAASGLGALGGALHLAARKTVLGLGRTIVFSTGTFGVALIGFALSNWLWLSLILMLVAGFGMMVEMAASNTILQTIVDENKRGRVMSFYTMSFLGMAPLGSLFAGALASAVDARTTVLIGGAACVLGALLFAFKLPQIRVLVRPIYVQMGILPQVATGLQSVVASEE